MCYDDDDGGDGDASAHVCGSVPFNMNAPPYTHIIHCVRVCGAFTKNPSAHTKRNDPIREPHRGRCSLVVSASRQSIAQHSIAYTRVYLWVYVR